MYTGQVLLQLIVILVVVQLCGSLCSRIGQQWVIGEILAGLALGPSLIGWLWPGLESFLFPGTTLPILQTLGDIGLILYMFSLGSRLDINQMWRQGRKAIVTSLSGILLPFTLGAALAFFMYPNFAGPKATSFSFLLLIGTAMAITAFPVLARLLVEKGLIETKIGLLALSCAAVDDVIAWCLLALVITVIHSSSLLLVLLTIGLIILFTVILFMVIRPLLILAERRIHSKPILLTFVLILLLCGAYITSSIGVHPVFGAFLVGLVLPRTELFADYTRNIDQVNTILFLPLFFVYSGLRTQIGLINSPILLLLCLLIILVACVGKIGGGTLSARWMGETWRDAFRLGFLMNTRGLVGLIVLNIGLSLGVLSPTLFTILVVMALITTMMASPLLSLITARFELLE